MLPKQLGRHRLALRVRSSGEQTISLETDQPGLAQLDNDTAMALVDVVNEYGLTAKQITGIAGISTLLAILAAVAAVLSVQWFKRRSQSAAPPSPPASP